MKVYKVVMIKGTTIYVIGLNEGDSTYKAYLKTTNIIGAEKSNEKYSEFMSKVLNVIEVCEFDVDNEKYNIY